MMNINQSKTAILSSFLNSLINQLKVDRVLLLDHAEFGMFDGVTGVEKDIYNRQDGIPESGKWDLIIANLPLGIKDHITKTVESAVGLLSDSGIIFTSGEPLLLRDDGKGIRDLLRKKNCSLAAILNAPDGLLKPYTELRIPFLIIKKSSSEGEFLGELSSAEQAEQLANNFVAHATGSTLDQGVVVQDGKFDGFGKWKVRQQIQALETEYKNFNTTRLGDLLKAVNTVKPKEEFTNLPNCLYLHKVGTKAATSNIENLTSNHSYFYQCVCEETLVDASYLESFFASKLGRLILNTLSSGSYIPNITLQSLSEASISIPALKAQKEIVNSISKLRKIKEAIGQFEDDLAVNPIGSDQTLNQIDFMLEVVGGLADSDKVMSLIRGGESKQTEFKETLTLDVKKQTKEKYIELSAIKTIAAFMNSASGTLIIGVHDSGEVNGVDLEIAKFYKTHDDFLLKFRNLVKERIGGQAYDFIDYRLVKISEKHVLLVECRESPIPIYVDDNDFYVRTNPATDKLDGPKMVTYITNHFIKK
jgi:hypothetical protein